jgi:hypothetical protein
MPPEYLIDIFFNIIPGIKSIFIKGGKGGLKMHSEISVEY